MFKDNTELILFVENEDELILDQVLESAIVDAFVYEGEYVEKAVAKYIEMLEADDVDEAFEEHLSTVLAPYMSYSSSFYENLILEAKVHQVPKGYSGKKSMRDKMSDLRKSLKGGKEKVGTFLKSAREKYGAKALGAKLSRGYAGAKKVGGDVLNRVKTAIASGMSGVKGAWDKSIKAGTEHVIKRGQKREAKAAMNRFNKRGKAAA